jgi:recombinational DNA repair protein RecR
VTEDVKRIEEILVAMDADVDGKLEADLILEVLDLVSKHKGVDINAKEMNKLVELLKKEDMLEVITTIKINFGRMENECLFVFVGVGTSICGRV